MSSRIAAAAAVLAMSVAALPCAAFQCNECHSKNPKMVRMHRELQGRNCFDCHQMGKKLMGKVSGAAKEDPFARRASDPVCRECHPAEQPKKQ